MITYSSVFKVLSDNIRLQIVAMLNKNDLCACKILESFEISQPTLSYHMKALCDSGLVLSRREGNRTWYSLNKENLAETASFLSALSSGGSVERKSDEDE